jgi:hypothetical protein
MRNPVRFATPPVSGGRLQGASPHYVRCTSILVQFADRHVDRRPHSNTCANMATGRTTSIQYEKLTVTHLSRNLPPFIDPEGQAQAQARALAK